MIRVLSVLFFVSVSWIARAQQYDHAFHVGWNILVPFSDKDFTGSTSSAGIRLGYSKLATERFGFGVEIGYSTLDDYVPPKTYVFDGGAVTTDRYNYLYYLTAMANAQYHFAEGKHFMPYTALGMGVAVSQYKVFYNVYQDSDNSTGFVIRPEIGTLIRIKEYSGFGLKAALGLDYATIKNEYFGAGNFAGLNLQLGIVLLNQ